MLNIDEIRGRVRRILGAIKENLGWLTDDHKAEGEGKAGRIEGKVQEHDAKARRQVETVVDTLEASNSKYTRPGENGS